MELSCITCRCAVCVSPRALTSLVDAVSTNFPTATARCLERELPHGNPHFHANTSDPSMQSGGLDGADDGKAQEHFGVEAIAVCTVCAGFFHRACAEPFPQESVFECPKCRTQVDPHGERQKEQLSMAPATQALLVPTIALQSEEQQQQQANTRDDQEISQLEELFEEDLVLLCPVCRQADCTEQEQVLCTSCRRVFLHERCCQRLLQQAAMSTDASSERSENVRVSTRRKRARTATSASKKPERRVLCRRCSENSNAWGLDAMQCHPRRFLCQQQLENECLDCNRRFFVEKSSHTNGTSDDQLSDQTKWKCLHCLDCSNETNWREFDRERAEPTSTASMTMICGQCENGFQVDEWERQQEARQWLCVTCSASTRLLETPDSQIPVTTTEAPPDDFVVCQNCLTKVQIPTSKGKHATPLDVASIKCTNCRSDISLIPVTLLICDGCEGEFDFATLNPPLDQVPEGDWFCDGCAKANGKAMPAVQSPPHEMTTVILCDGCDGEYDLRFLDPPLEKVPEGEWFCALCMTNRQQLQQAPKLPKKRGRKPKKKRGRPVWNNPVSEIKAEPPTVAVNVNNDNDCTSSAEVKSDAQTGENGHPDQTLAIKSESSSVVVACPHVEKPSRKRQLPSSPRLNGVKHEDPEVMNDHVDSEQATSRRKSKKRKTKRSGKKRSDNKENNRPAANNKETQVPATCVWLPEPVEPLSSEALSDPATQEGDAVGSSTPAATDFDPVDDEEEPVILICDSCCGEFKKADVLPPEVGVPKRPWFCSTCSKSIKKSRKRKQTLSKQMLLELQLYGALLRQTAAKNLPRAGLLSTRCPSTPEEMETMFGYVGKRVVLHMKWENLWCAGRIMSFDTTARHHLVAFHDRTERWLPLYSLPMLLGTTSLVHVKLPTSKPFWWPAQIMEMNVLAKKMLLASADTDALERFRLVHLFSGNATARSSSGVCWVPKDLCRSSERCTFPSADELLETHSREPGIVSSIKRNRTEYELAMKTQQQEKAAERSVLEDCFGFLVRQQATRLRTALIGFRVELQLGKDEWHEFEVQSYSPEANHQLVPRNPTEDDDAKREVDLLSENVVFRLQSPHDLCRIAARCFEGDSNESGEESATVSSEQAPVAVDSASDDEGDELICGTCFLGKSLLADDDEHFVQCSKCLKNFHWTCCDPPHSAFPVVNADNEVVTEDTNRPYLCSDCTSCTGCGTDQPDSSGWYRWKLPLQVVSLCSKCVDAYEKKEYCAVCYGVFSEAAFACAENLLKCENCKMWVHADCELDQSAAFHQESFSLAMSVPESLTDVDDSESTSGGKANESKPARLVDEEFASTLVFDSSYDPETTQNYECLCCRKLNMLTVLDKVVKEDKLELFREPVTKIIAPTYFDVIKHPMDLKTMQQKVLDDCYHSIRYDEFVDDLELICLNAVTFNTKERDFLVWREAWRFHGQMKRILRQSLPKSMRSGKYSQQLLIAANKPVQTPATSKPEDNKQEPTTSQEPTKSAISSDSVKQQVNSGVSDATADNTVLESTTTIQVDAIAAEADAPAKTEDVSHRESLGTESTDPLIVSLPTEESTQKTQLSIVAPRPAVKVFEYQKELGDLPMHGSLISELTALVLYQSRFLGHTYCWSDLCLVCGCHGTSYSPLVFCVDCGEGYHSFCAGLDMDLLLREKPKSLLMFWRCPNCKICEICGLPREKSQKLREEEEEEETKGVRTKKLEICGVCQRGYHRECLVPPLERSQSSRSAATSDRSVGHESTLGDFYCYNCIECRHCDRIPAEKSFSRDRNSCYTCWSKKQNEQVVLVARQHELIQFWTTESKRKKRMAEKCPVCMLKWNQTESLIQCDACELWVHLACDPMDAKRMEKLLQDESSMYVCACCRTKEREHLKPFAARSSSRRTNSSANSAGQEDSEISAHLGWKLHLLVADVEQKMEFCDSKWQEAKEQMQNLNQWKHWKEKAALYLCTLRLGDECLKSVSFRSKHLLATAHLPGIHMFNAEELSTNGLLIPKWLVQRAHRYVRMKRYTRGPRAMQRRLLRKQSWNSQEPDAICSMVTEATTCAAFLACCHLFYGWKRLPKFVIQLLNSGFGAGKTLPKVLLEKLQAESEVDVEEEMALLIKQYDRRGGGPKLLQDSCTTVNNEEIIDTSTNKREEPQDDKATSNETIQVEPESFSMKGDRKLDESDPTTVNGFTLASPSVGWPIGSTFESSFGGPYVDNRFCCMCFGMGDETICGRLLVCDIDQFVHSNCAIWSTDVSESDGGVLLKIHKAKHRSRNNRCTACGLAGATIGCCVPRCQAHYHFHCALDSGVVFLENNDTCCPQSEHLRYVAEKMQLLGPGNGSFLHLPSVGDDDTVSSCTTPLTDVATPPMGEQALTRQMSGLSPHGGGSESVETEPDLESADDDEVKPEETPQLKSPQQTSAGVPKTTTLAPSTSAYDAIVDKLPAVDPIQQPLRTLICDTALNGDEKPRFQRLFKKDQVVFRIGALCVHSLGRIVASSDYFHTREWIFPLGFHSTRIFWSTKTAGTRCLYECVISSDQLEQDSAEAQTPEYLAKPVFKIVPSDDLENPIVASCPNDALHELRSRLVTLYESSQVFNSNAMNGLSPDDHDHQAFLISAITSPDDPNATLSKNPLLNRSSWFSYGLLGCHFFGFGLPAILKEIEQLPQAATTGISRAAVSGKNSPNPNNQLASPIASSKREVYVFKYKLPDRKAFDLARAEVAQQVFASERATHSTGCARTDGWQKSLRYCSKRVTKRRRGFSKHAETLNVNASGIAVGTTGAERAPTNASSSSGSASQANSTVSNTGGPATSKGTDILGKVIDIEHLPIPMQYRDLRRRNVDERLEVRKSHIHGYGLFTKEKFVEGQMIVEYQGQMIGQKLADQREKRYEEQGLGSCYMFRLDPTTIIDATRVGNVARFINHSCDPKAFARVISVENNEKKIVIFAKKAIDVGDEITYDYKFPLEDEAIRCDCNAPNCIGRMN